MNSTATCLISRCFRAISTAIKGRGAALGLALLVMLAAALCFGAPVRADGLVVDARSAGLAGPQVDAATLSPVPRPVSAGTAAPRTYVVQPGDSLTAIAARFATDGATLTRNNQLADPDRLVAGQTLVVGAASVGSPVLPPGGAIERIQFWPWPPVQGQTVAVWIQARRATTLSLRFAGRDFPLALTGGRGQVLLPVDALALAEDARLEIYVGAQSASLAFPVQAGAFPSYNIPEETGGGILTDAERVRQETARMLALFGDQSTAGAWQGRQRFLPPLAGDFPPSAPFGQRRTYGASTTVTAHTGQDYSAAPGTPVYAPAAGEVALAETLFVRGNALVLDHGGGVFSGYWHLSELAVQPGERVSAGQLIGKVGNTGLSTGAHLHWEMRIAGVAVDPRQWLRQ